MSKYEKEIGTDGLSSAIDEICMSVEEIITTRPLSQTSQSQMSSQTLSESSQIFEQLSPSSSPQDVATSGPEIIDLTFSDDEDVKPILPPATHVNAEAGPSNVARFNQSRTPVNLKPSLKNLDNPEWHSEINFLCEDDNHMTLNEALNKLSGPQLKELEKQMKVKSEKKTVI